MALLTAPPSFAFCTTNLPATPVTGGPGGSTPTPGTSGADGTTVSAFTLTHDCEYLIIGCDGENVVAANCSTVLDVMVDPAGGTSWSVLIPDLIVGFAQDPGNTVCAGVWFHFPIWIKSGSAVGVRGAANHTVTGTLRTALIAYGGNRNPGSWWCGRSVAAIGMTTATVGTNHTPGNTNAFSSWTDFGSTLAAPVGALQFAIQGTNTVTAMNQLQYMFEFGVAGNRIGPPLVRSDDTNENGWRTPTGPIFRSLKTGTQLQVRATCSGTAQAHDVAAYGVS